MAGPAIVIVAGTITAWLAFSGADGLVEDDYYKQGMAVNQRMQRDAEAIVRGLAADIVLGSDGRQVEVGLTDGGGFAQPSQLRLHLAHPTRAGLDQQVALNIGNDGRYRGELIRAMSGRWYVVIDDAGGRWRLVGEWNLDAGRRIGLLAKRVTSTDGGR